MAVRIADIAKKLGLSEATVSLALNNKEVINYKTRQKVQETAQEMGYSPNAMARVLARQKSTMMIGIIITDISNAYFGELAKSCEQALHAYQYISLFASSFDSHRAEKRIIDQFISLRVAGVIIVPTAHDYVEIDYLEKLESFGIRYVFATSYYSTVKAPYVMVNLEKGTYQSVKYLLDLGHRRIFFLGADPQMVPTGTRLNGYRRAFMERGLEVDPKHLIFCRSPDIDNGYTSTMNLIRSGEPVDAIITINDSMAIGSLRALMECGVKIPEELSLIGYDDIVYAGLTSIPLTTVRQDVRTIGKKSVEMLMQMIQNEKQSQDNFLIEPEFVVRGSTGLCKHTGSES